jgi:SAM-dependent methyltransferase
VPTPPATAVPPTSKVSAAASHNNLGDMAPASTCIVCAAPQYELFRHGDFAYARCERCGLVSSVPLPSEDEIIAHYAGKFAAGNYELSRRFLPQIRRVYRQFVDSLAALIDLRSGPRVLDVGCFTGDFLVQLAERGADVYGLELQPEAVEIAQRALPGRVFRADVHGTRFPEGPFDVVTATGLIEHVIDPVALLRRMSDLLRPGGILLLETPDSGSAVARLLGRFWPPYATVEHIHLFSRRSLVRALGTSFEDVRSRPHWKPLPVEYVYENMKNFGPELRRVLSPVYHVLPRYVQRSALPFYVGEMIVTAKKAA